VKSTNTTEIQANMFSIGIRRLLVTQFKVVNPTSTLWFQTNLQNPPHPQRVYCLPAKTDDLHNVSVKTLSRGELSRWRLVYGSPTTTRKQSPWRQRDNPYRLW